MPAQELKKALLTHCTARSLYLTKTGWRSCVLALGVAVALRDHGGCRNKLIRLQKEGTGVKGYPAKSDFAISKVGPARD